MYAVTTVSKLFTINPQRLLYRTPNTVTFSSANSRGNLVALWFKWFIKRDRDVVKGFLATFSDQSMFIE